MTPSTATAESESERRDPPESLILAAFALAAVAATAVVIGLAEADAVRDPAQKALRGEVTGLSEHSLVRRENFARALRRVADDSRASAGVVNLRLAPERMDVEVRDNRFRRSILHVDPGLGIKRDAFGEGEDRTIEPDSIDSAAPQRILLAIMRRARVDADELDYMALGPASDTVPLTWFARLKHGRPSLRDFHAAADGSDVRRSGELPAADRVRQEREQLRLRRYTRCIERADDAGELARCRR